MTRTSKPISRAAHRRGGRILLPCSALLLLAAGLIFLYTQRQAVLAWPGTFLAVTEAPVKADAVVVLAGGTSGDRIVEAGRLVKEGFAPVALVSGPTHWYEVCECEPAIALAVRRGFPREYFQCVPHRELSTKAEAPVLLAAARQRRARTVLVVTSDFHTRRARSIYRRLGAGLDIHMVAAPNQMYRLNEWYRNRESRKIVLLEWIKTVTAPFGL